MSVLIQLRDAHKRYGDQVLLDGAEMALYEGAKVGLIGRNGSGKSTLCRILLDQEELDRGEVIRRRNLRVGYLRQDDPFQDGESALDYLIRDSGQAEWRCGEMAARFALKGDLLQRPVRELSGGWQTRVKLAALLLHDPQLLVLDEPTNFLDLRTQMLLEHFLRDFRGACLVVSHDRGFLNSTCEQTLDLARGKLTLYPGTVDAYLEFQDEQRLHDERVNATVMAKRRQLQTFIDKNRGRPSTASQARSKAKQLRRLEVKEIEGPESTVRIRLPEIEPRRGTALLCRDLAIGYGQQRVADKIRVDVDHGARAAVVGDNGQGKTTFLRTVTGSLPPVSGEVDWGYGCEVGCYAQHVYTALPADKTIDEYLNYVTAPGTTSQTVLDVAGSFLFSGELIEKRIGVLSGGERARVCLAGLLLGQYNVLVLDEPLNHLDMPTVEALADALLRYEGTVIFTSHDRHFMHRVATSVIEVRDGRVVNYPDSYDSYLYRVGREIDEGQRPAGPRQKDQRKNKTSRPAEKQRHVDGKPLHALRKESASLERQLAKLEEQKEQLSRQLLAATTPADAQRLFKERAALDAQATEVEQRWFALQEELEG